MLYLSTNWDVISHLPQEEQTAVWFTPISRKHARNVLLAHAIGDVLGQDEGWTSLVTSSDEVTRLKEDLRLEIPRGDLDPDQEAPCLTPRNYRRGGDSLLLARIGEEIEYWRAVPVETRNELDVDTQQEARAGA